MKEQRITHEAAESLMLQVEQAIATGLDETTVTLLDNDLRFERSPDGGFTIRAPDQPVGLRVFPGSEAAPAGYPTDLPFVPNETVTTSESDATVSLIWWASSDPERIWHDLDRHSVDAGWVLLEGPHSAAAHVLRKSYVKASMQRWIQLSQGIVTLLQKPARG